MSEIGQIVFKELDLFGDWYDYDALVSVISELKEKVNAFGFVISVNNGFLMLEYRYNLTQEMIDEEKRKSLESEKQQKLERKKLYETLKKEFEGEINE